MENLLKSIENSLENKNWYSALVLSLILPDICGKIEDKNQSSTERYPVWFDKYLGEKYNGFLSGHDCYALRCSFLHEGHSNIDERGASEKQKEQDILNRFMFLSRGAHCNRLNNCHFGDSRYDGKQVLQLSVYDFCQDFIEATRKWLNDDTVLKNMPEMLEIHENEILIGNGAMRIGGSPDL